MVLAAASASPVRTIALVAALVLALAASRAEPEALWSNDGPFPPPPPPATKVGTVLNPSEKLVKCDMPFGVHQYNMIQGHPDSRACLENDCILRCKGQFGLWTLIHEGFGLAGTAIIETSPKWGYAPKMWCDGDFYSLHYLNSFEQKELCPEYDPVVEENYEYCAYGKCKLPWDEMNLFEKWWHVQKLTYTGESRGIKREPVVFASSSSLVAWFLIIAVGIGITVRVCLAKRGIC